MRIAVDTRDLQIAKTGTRTFLEEVCKALSQISDQHELVFLQPSQQVPTSKSTISKIKNHFRYYWWKQVALPWKAYRQKCDVIFCTDYVVPYFTSCATFPVFHDAGFWERADNYNRYWLKLLNTIAIPAAAKSLAIITVSKSAKERLVRSLDIPPEKFEVVYEAPKKVIHSSLLFPERRLNILRKYGLDNTNPFILCVGVLEKRKNLTRLVAAFSQAIDQLPKNFKLVLVGQTGPKQDMDDSLNIRRVIKDNKLESRVILTGYVPDEELGAFYQSALIYAFPSLYEGFGLPLLEAFANKLPVIAANSTSLPEIAGDAALFFDPLDIENICQTIIQVSNDPTLRVKLAKKGLAQLEKFSWEKTAQQLIDIFERVQK